MGLFSKPPSLLSLSREEEDQLRVLTEPIVKHLPRSATDATILVAKRAVAATLLEAHVINTGSFVIPYKLCDVYMDLQRFAEALDVGRELVEQFPNDPRSWYVLGTIYHTLGRVRENEIAPERLQMMRQALSPSEIVQLVASETIEKACQQLSLNPMRASELAATYFSRTLEVGVRRGEQSHVEECLKATRIHYESRKSGTPI